MKPAFVGMRLALCLALFGSAAFAAADKDVTIDGGKAPLHGSLLMPDGEGAVPAVLLLAGSGPTDRDGNSTIPGIKPATLKLIAGGLAADGIGSLRVDKRGIGASAPAMTAEKDLRFDTYVDDAVAWIKFLKAQPHVSCVYVLGHSEGALVGALAAAKAEVCGYISVSGAGLPAGELLLRQLKDRHVPEPALETATNIVRHLEKGETVADVPPKMMALFRPSVQPYLISWFAKDPRKAVAALKMPVLIMQGTTDIQVGADEAELLAKAHPGAQLVMLKGANHVLKIAPADFKANLATYADPKRPLAPEVVPALVQFIRQNK